MLSKGDLAPDFTLQDQDGKELTLSHLLKDGPVVLFFYPAALSGGCTVESCHFRDLASEFAQVKAQPLGISPDDVSTQKRFDEAHGLGFPLVADPDRTVAEAFGVRRKYGPTSVKRATFVIGTDRTILDAIGSEFRMAKHADDALKALQPAG